jgi:hypothetical protein
MRSPASTASQITNHVTTTPAEAPKNSDTNHPCPASRIAPATMTAITKHAATNTTIHSAATHAALGFSFASMDPGCMACAAA